MNEEALGIPRGSLSRAERLWTPAACGRGSRKLRRIHVWLGPGERQTETEEGRERQRRGEAGRQREARPLARKHAHRRTRLILRATSTPQSGTRGHGHARTQMHWRAARHADTHLRVSRHINTQASGHANMQVCMSVYCSHVQASPNTLKTPVRSRDDGLAF